LERRGKFKASDTPGSVNEGATSNPPAYQLEHSVEADVSPSFAWNWRTDVKNWDDPPARFQLDGPFARGSSGSTVLPGQAPLHWRIREVQPGRSFVIEMPLDQAVLSFEWRFDAVADRRTRITQRIVLSGENASAFAEQVQVNFSATLSDGMKRIADAMARAERSTETGSDHD
jgi:Polyketide cyclase / dehydrase and lipid transport